MPHTTVTESDLPRADLTQLDATESRVPHVEQAFARLRCRGEYLRVWDGGGFPRFRYTSTKQNSYGFNNHLQGMMRLRNGPYAVMSGGDPHDTMSHLFVLKLGTKVHVGAGPWRSNTLLGDPLQHDGVISTIEIDPILWHGGGMSTLGDLLAVPIETSDSPYSRIVFFDMGQPEQPGRIDPSLDIKRPGEKAGAVALARLDDGRYLCGVWSDSDSLPVRLDCYVSRSSEFSDGWLDTPTRWYASTARAAGIQSRKVPKFQAVNFVRQSDGALYLVGMHNTAAAAPIEDGHDEAHLFTFEISSAGDPPAPVPKPTVTKVGTYRFRCNHCQCNMDASSGVHVASDGRLYLYAGFHFRMGPGPERQLRFNEFRPHTEALPPTSLDPQRAWLELFEEPYFEGRFLSMQGLQDTSISDYGRLRVQSSRFGFHDKVSSVRYQLPEGMRYVLFKHSHFKTRLVELAGTGELEEIPDFGVVQAVAGGGHADNAVSSSHYEFRDQSSGAWSAGGP